MRLRLPLLLLKAVMATCISTSSWSVSMICASSFTSTSVYAADAEILGGIIGEDYTASFSDRSLSVNQGAAAVNFTGRILPSGSGAYRFAVTETGSGDLTLSGDNDFGTFTSNGGKLILAHTNALGGSGNLTFNGDAELSLSTNISNTSRAVVAGSSAMTASIGAYDLTLGDFTSGSLVKTGAGKLAVGALNTGAIRMAGGLSFSALSGIGDITLTGTATLANTVALTIARAITGSGALTLAHGDYATTYSGNITTNNALTETGTGDLTLSGANNFTTFTSDGGKLVLNNASALGGNGAMTFTADAELSLGATIANTNRSVTAGANAMTITGGGYDLTLGNFVSGNLTKTGAGTLTLNGAANQIAGITFEGGMVLASLNNTAGAIQLSGDGTLTLKGMTIDQRGLALNGHDLTLNINGNVSMGALARGAGTLTVMGAHKISFAGVDSSFADLTIGVGQTQEYRTGDVQITGTLTMGAGSTLSTLVGGISVNTLDLVGAGNTIDGYAGLYFTGAVVIADTNGNTSLESQDGDITFAGDLSTAGANTTVTASSDISILGSLIVTGTGATAKLTATSGELDVTGDVSLSAQSELTARTTMTLNGSTLLAGDDIKLTSAGDMTFVGDASITGSRVTVASTAGSLLYRDELNISVGMDGVALTADAGAVTIEEGLTRAAGDVTTAPLISALNDISISQGAQILGSMTLTSTAGKLLFSTITAGQMIESIVSTVLGTEFDNTEMDITGGTITGPTLVAKGGSDVHMTGTALAGTPQVDVMGDSVLTMTDMTAALGDVVLNDSEDNEFLVNGSSELTADQITVENGHLNVTGASALAATGDVYLKGGISLVNDDSLLAGNVFVTGGGDDLPSVSSSIKNKQATFTLTGLGTVLDGNLTIGEVTGAGSARISERALVSGNVTISGEQAWLALDNARLGGTLTVTDSNLYVTGSSNLVRGKVSLTGTSKVNIYDGVFSVGDTLTLGTDAELNISQLDDVGGITGGEFIGTVVVDGGTINLRKSGKVTGEIFFGSTVDDVANSGILNVTENTTWITEADITFNQNGIINIDASSSVELKGNANLNGTGTLTKQGAGDLIVNTSNTAYEGDIDLTAGSLVVGATEALGNVGTLKTSNGTTLRSTADVTISKGLKLAGDSFTINAASTLNWVGAVLVDGQTSDHTLIKDGLGNLILSEATLKSVQVNQGKLTLATQQASADTVTLEAGAALDNKGNIKTLEGKGNNVILIDGGSVSNTADLVGGSLIVQNGLLTGSTLTTDGTVIAVTGVSSLGDTSLTGGSLSMTAGSVTKLTTNSAVVNLSGVLVGGLVNVTGGTLTMDSSQLLGGLIAGSDATLQLTGTNLTGTMTLTNSAGVLNQGILNLTTTTINGGGTLALIGSTGALGTLDLNGTGSAVLSGGSALMGGAIDIDAGASLRLTSGAVLNSAMLTSVGNVSVDNAILKITGLNNTGNIQLAQGARLESSGDIAKLGNVSASGAGTTLASEGNIILDLGKTSLSESAVLELAENKTLIVSGTGVLELATQTTLKGDLQANAGSLISLDNAFMIGKLTTNGNSAVTLTSSSLTGDLDLNDGAVTLGYSRILGSAVVNGGTLTLNASEITHNLTINAGGALVINGANTIGGDFVVNGGLTMNGTINVIGDTVVSGALTINQTWTGNVTINGADGHVTLAAPNGNIDGNINFGIAGGKLTLQTDFITGKKVVMTGDGTIALGTSEMIINGLLEGAGDLTVTGTGTLALGNANTSFSGDMDLAAGMKLRLDHAESLNVQGDDVGQITAGDGVTILATVTSNISKNIDSDGELNLDSNSGAVLTVTGDTTVEDLVKKGEGDLVLAGQATLGSLDIKSGDVTVSGAGSSLGDVTLAGNTSLTGTGTELTGLSLGGVATIDFGASGLLTGSIAYNSSGKAFISAQLMTADSMSISQLTADFGSGSVLSSRGDLSIDDSNLNLLDTDISSTAGSLILAGTTLDADGSTLFGGTSLNIADASSIDLDNNSIIWSEGTLTIANSDLAANDSLIHGNTSVTVTGSELELRNDSTLSSAGDISITGSHLTSDDSTITTTGDVNIASSEMDLTNDSMIYAEGTLTLTGVQGDMSDSSLIGGDIVLQGTQLDAYNNSLIKGGASITLGGDSELNLTNSAIEAGTITLEGDSELNLTNSEYISDTTDITDGILTLTGSETKASLGDLNVGVEGALLIDNVQSVSVDAVANLGDIALVNGSVLTLTDTLTNSGSIGLSSSILNAEDIGNTGSITLKNGSTLNGGTFTQTGENSLLELNDTSHAHLSELAVAGGNVTLSGTSTLEADSVEQTGGTITLNQGTALTATNGYRLNGGMLNVNFATLTGNLNATTGTANLTHSTLKGDLLMDGASTVNITDQSLVMGSIWLNNGGSLTIRDSIVDGSVTVNGDTTDAWLTLDNATINYHLTVTGDTTLTLNRTNTIKGTSTIAEGSTIIGNGTIVALNQVFDIKGTYVLNNQHEGDLTVSRTGLLRLTDGAELNGDIIFFNTDFAGLNPGEGARIEVAGANGNKNFLHKGDLLVKINGSINTVGAGDGYSLKGELDGTGHLTKLGAGSLTLEKADSTFRGDLLLNGGKLVLKATEALGDYGTLKLTGDNVIVQTTKDISLNKDVEMEDDTLHASLDIEKKSTLNLAGDIDIQGTLNLTNLGTLDITGDDSYLNTVNVMKGAMNVSGRDNAFDNVSLSEGTLVTSDGDNTFVNLTANRGTIILDGSIHGSDTVTGDIILTNKSDLTVVDGIMDAADKDMTLTSGSKVHFKDTTGIMGDVTLDGTAAWDILNTKPGLGLDNGALELTGNLESDGSIHMQYADMTVNGTTDILNSLMMENSLLNGKGAMTLGGALDTNVVLVKSGLVGDTTLDLINATTTADESLIMGNELTISGGTADLVNNSTLEGTTELEIMEGADITLTDSTLNAGELNIAQAGDSDDSSLTLTDSEMNVGDDMNIGGKGDVTLIGSTGTVGGDLSLTGNGSLTVGGDSDMTISGSTDLTDNGGLLVDDNSKLTTDSITADGNSSVTVANGSQLEITSGKGEIAIDLGGNSSLTVTGTGKDETTPTLDTNGGDIVIGDSSTTTISDALVDMDYDGTLILKDNGTLTLTDTTILGNVATVGDTEFHLNLENVTIKKDPNWAGEGERGGNLTVTGGNLTLTGDNVAEGTVSVSGDASITINNGGSLSTDADDDVVIVDPDGEVNIGGGESGGEGGTLNSDLVLRGGDINLNTGAVINGDILFRDTDPVGEEDRTLNVNDDFTLGEDHHLIVDAETGDNLLNIDGDKSFTLDGQMAGNADLILSGEGTLVLNSNNSETVAAHGQHGLYENGYIGDLIMTGGGTIVLGDDEAMGSEGTLVVTDKDATLGTVETVSSSKDIFVGGVDLDVKVAGKDAELTLTGDALVETDNDGSLTKTGSGTLTFDGTGVDIENLNVNEGTLNLVGIGGDFNDIDTTTITGNAVLNITDSLLDGDVLNVNGGTTNLKNSTLNLDVTGTTGIVNVGKDVTVNGDITFDRNAEGSDGMLVNVNEDFIFGSEDYSLIVNDHGTINIAKNKTMTLNGHLEGSGLTLNVADITLTKDGEGKLIINTSNTAYTGNLELKAGSIDVSHKQDALGSGQLISSGDAKVNILAGNGDTSLGNGITMAGNHVLTLNTEAETTIRNNTFTGTEGSIVKVGGECLILDNISGESMIGTDLNIKKGNLYLTDTQLGNKVTLARDTVLEGDNSSVASLLAQKGSSVHLGLDKSKTGSHNGYGSLTVSDKLEMSSGSSFFVDISGDNRQNDKVTTGKAHLRGANVVINDRGGKDEGKGAWKNEQRYQLVSTDTVESGFDWHVDGLYYLNAHLEQNSGGVDLVLTQNHKGINGKTHNQTQISNALETIDNGKQATGELKDMIHAFEHTQSRGEALQALENVGGLGLTSMMSQQVVGNLNHMRNVNSAIGTGIGGTAQEFDGKGMIIGTSFVPKNQFWIQSTGAFSTIDCDGNGSGFDRNSWGMAAGFERTLSKEFLLGIAFSYEDADIKTTYPTQGGSSYDSENIYFDLYAKWQKGPWQMKGLVGFGSSDISLDRYVNVAGNTGAGFMKHANGGTTGSSINFAYELSYDFVLNESTLIQPLFTIESSGNSIDGYTESGSIGNAGLNIQDQDAWMTTLGLGARLVKDFTAFSNAPKGSVQLRALLTDSVGDQASNVDAAFIGAQETRYILSPADQQRIGFLIGADVLVPVSNQTSIFAGASAEYKGSDQNITGNLGVRITF